MQNTISKIGYSYVDYIVNKAQVADAVNQYLWIF